MAAQDKNSFHYRMSKKVAELTQVVHMLFSRNHEKEVEMVALKESYEYEIELVIQDAKSRIAKLENTIEELNKNLDTAQQGHGTIDAALLGKDFEWSQKLAEKEKCLQNERAECQNLRNTLQNTQSNLESLKRIVDLQIAAKSNDILKKDKELEELQSRLAAAEIRHNSIQTNEKCNIDELRKANEKLSNDIIQLQSLLDKSCNNNDQLMSRNKRLEAELKELRAICKKLSQESMKQNKDSKILDVNDELDRLRQEVQRYRLELSNRDNNFTKMFCERQPAPMVQKSAELQQKGMMSLVVSPGYSRNSSPFGFLKMTSSGPQMSPLTKERPSLLGNWDSHRKPSISNSTGTESENIDHEQFNNQHIPNDFRHQSTKKHSRLLNVKENIQNKPEFETAHTGGADKKLPLLRAVSESGRMTAQLTKPKTLTKSSLYVKEKLIDQRIKTEIQYNISMFYYNVLVLFLLICIEKRQSLKMQNNKHM